MTSDPPQHETTAYDHDFRHPRARRPDADRGRGARRPRLERPLRPRTSRSPAKSETYRGERHDHVRRSPRRGDTFLDYRGKTIELLEVNGQRIDSPDWNGYRLTLPGSALRATSENTVRVVYENDYDHTGDGFHQFIDPEDGEEYLYSNFEPYEAHRLFPSFDQPDIKATLHPHRDRARRRGS